MKNLNTIAPISNTKKLEVKSYIWIKNCIYEEILKI